MLCLWYIFNHERCGGRSKDIEGNGRKDLEPKGGDWGIDWEYVNYKVAPHLKAVCKFLNMQMLVIYLVVESLGNLEVLSVAPHGVVKVAHGQIDRANVAGLPCLLPTTSNSFIYLFIYVLIN